MLQQLYFAVTTVDLDITLGTVLKGGWLNYIVTDRYWFCKVVQAFWALIHFNFLPNIKHTPYIFPKIIINDFSSKKRFDVSTVKREKKWFLPVVQELLFRVKDCEWLKIVPKKIDWSKKASIPRTIKLKWEVKYILCFC